MNSLEATAIRRTDIRLSAQLACDGLNTHTNGSEITLAIAGDPTSPPASVRDDINFAPLPTRSREFRLPGDAPGSAVENSSAGNALPTRSQPLRIPVEEDAAGNARPNWKNLFNTIRARLETANHTNPLGTPGPLIPLEDQDEPGEFQPGVTTLALLRASLRESRTRCHALETTIAEAHAALALVKAALAGTLADKERAQYLASHDDLTDLPNRTGFLESLDRAIDAAREKQHSMAVLYIDLDGFKEVNDRQGHRAGDEVLRIVAARIARGMRSIDIVGRLGGDEFVCVVTASPHGRVHLVRLVSKLHSLIAAPIRLHGVSIAVPPSIGIAIFPGDGNTSAVLMGHADSAMYRAKRKKAGFAFYDPRHDKMSSEFV